MVTEIWVNIGSGNGLLPDGTKPLSEPMLTDHQQSPVTFILGLFHKRCLNHQSPNLFENCMFKFPLKSPRDQWVNCAWLHQAITPTYVASSSVKCISIHMRHTFTWYRLNTTQWNFQIPQIPTANQLMQIKFFMKFLSAVDLDSNDPTR